MNAFFITMNYSKGDLDTRCVWGGCGDNLHHSHMVNRYGYIKIHRNIRCFGFIFPPNIFSNQEYIHMNLMYSIQVKVLLTLQLKISKQASFLNIRNKLRFTARYLLHFTCKPSKKDFGDEGFWNLP